jgi:hypothetical protein
MRPRTFANSTESSAASLPSTLALGRFVTLMPRRTSLSIVAMINDCTIAAPTTVDVGPIGRATPGNAMAASP